MHLSVDGIVLQAREYGRSAKLLTLLTRQKGRITVIAPGAGSLKSRLKACATPFTYSSFMLFKNGDQYKVDSADVHELFYGLSGDIDRLALGQYFLEVAARLSREETEEEELLRLLLNSLYLLSRDADPVHVKLVFELRCASVSGFMPDFETCAVCGRDVPGWIDVYGGRLVCVDCTQRPAPDGFYLDAAAKDALRHIFYAPLGRIFSFQLSGAAKEQLSRFAERFLLAQTDERFSTLEFYRSLQNPI